MQNTALSIFTLPALVSLLLSFIATKITIDIAKKFDFIDDPKKNKHPKVIHSIPTPRAGGLGIFVAILISCLLFLPMDKHLIATLVGALILLIVGLIDDKKNPHPFFRLIAQFVAASLPIASGIGVAFLTNPFGGILDLSQPQITFTLFGSSHSIWLLADLFAILWIVILMNFLNMGAKGIPGQLPGVVSIAAFTIALLSLQYSADITQWPVTILAAILMGAYLGFLPWNMFPQRIMPSFSGSNIAGYFLGILSILSTTKVGTLLVVLAIPLIDTLYTIIKRVLSGKSPIWGDRGHLHHKLLDKGATQTQVTFIYWGVTALLAFLALQLNAPLKLYTMIAVGILLICLKLSN